MPLIMKRKSLIINATRPWFIIKISFHFISQVPLLSEILSNTNIMEQPHKYRVITAPAIAPLFIFDKGSGTLSFAKCLQINPTIGILNDFLHPYICTVYCCVMSSKWKASQDFAFSVYNLIKGVPGPYSLMGLLKHPACLQCFRKND